MINTDKKLTDNVHKQAAQASLQLLPLIMNNIPQAVFWKDKNLVYLGCNRAFAEDAGFSSPEEIIGKTDFDMPWKDQAELYRADDRRVLDSGESRLNYEEPQTTPEGSTISSTCPLSMTARSSLRYFCANSDGCRSKSVLPTSSASVVC
ncbi:MAG TPA: PAS domain-containing protein, partial [Anaerolineales bacterium]|nr:PAS domain-containing protein [Anaerolineales bacterium]